MTIISLHVFLLYYLGTGRSFCKRFSIDLASFLRDELACAEPDEDLERER